MNCSAASSWNFCKTRENSNFLKNYKIVISVKIQNFSRSLMTKWITPLESSHEILANKSNFIEFRDSRNLHVFQGTMYRVL